MKKLLFIAILALSLVLSTADALASTPATNGGTMLFDQGFVDFHPSFFRPRPLGRLGITWE